MRLSKPLFWLLAVLWFAAGTWWYSSCSKCSTCSTTLPAVTQKITLPGFAVSDSNWNLSTADNLRFGRSGNMPVLSADMITIVDSISMYAKNHPAKIITVTGFYKADEKNNSSFENLGLARANELKKLLESKGVIGTNILTKSQLEDGLVFSPADTLVGGISMIFNTMAEPVKEDLFEPRTVYFNTNKSALPVDTAFTNYIEKAGVYLKTHADKKLIITGYTDNVGSAERNNKLSADRAAFVKNELMKKGIADEKMASSGKGMNDPITDNNTADGRAKNRRVTIQLQ